MLRSVQYYYPVQISGFCSNCGRPRR